MLKHALLLTVLQLLLLSSENCSSGEAPLLLQSLRRRKLALFQVTLDQGLHISSEPSNALGNETESGSKIGEVDNSEVGSPIGEPGDRADQSSSSEDWNALGTSGKQTIIRVNQLGTGDYSTVQAAIDAVPVQNTQPVTITISSGTYLEKVYIPSSKPFISLIGEGREAPVISWNDTAASTGSTWDSSTFAIDAANFIAKRVTFQNSAPSPERGVEGGQAIALRIGGDMAAFYDCKFLGAQDTLCDWMGRHYFKSCFIQGSIDFIFGDGQSLYEGCSINSIAKTTGTITAQYRQTSTDAGGYSFVNCSISGTGSMLLGRAWGPFSRVVFSYTTMDNIIDPKGWGDWNNASVDGTIYYGEFANSGLGANLAGRAPFSRSLTQEQANPFLGVGWIDGSSWLNKLP